MVDATSSQAFQRILLDVIAGGRNLAGRVGKLVPTKSTRLAEMLNSGPPQSCRLLKMEQSNSSIIYDDKIYLKLFRKLEEGINPDLELTKQLSDKCGFEHVPAYLGDIQYVAPSQDPGSVVMIQVCTPNEQDGWSHTLGAVGRYFDRVLAEPQLPQPPLVGLWQEVPEPFAGIIEGVHIDTVRLLGERTAEMHVALAQDTESPDFAPEPFRCSTSAHFSSRFEAKSNKLSPCSGVLSAVLKSTPEVWRRMFLRTLKSWELVTISFFATRSM